MKFRKKPIVIEAEQYRVGGPLPFVEEGVLDYDEDTCEQTITTFVGRLTVSDGDWIIKGIKGEFYPCKPAIFDATYERVSSPSTLKTLTRYRSTCQLMKDPEGLWVAWTDLEAALQGEEPQ